MARRYTVEMQNVAVTGAITLVQIKVGASQVITILRAWVSQSNLGTSAMQRVQILRKTAAATVTSFTPILLDKGDAASGCAGGTSATGTNASVEGTDGDVLLETNFNVLNGFLHIPVPEDRFVVGPAGFIAIKLPGAPASSMTTSAGFTFEEQGG